MRRPPVLGRSQRDRFQAVTSGRLLNSGFLPTTPGRLIQFCRRSSCRPHGMPSTSPWTRGQPTSQSPKTARERGPRCQLSRRRLRQRGENQLRNTTPRRPVRAGRLRAPGTHPRAHGGPARAAYLPMMTTGPAAEVAMPAPDRPKAPRARAESAAPGAALCRSLRGRTVTHAHWLHAKPGRGAAPDWLGQGQGAGAPPRDPLGAAVGGASASRVPTPDAGLGQSPPRRTSRGHAEGKREDQTPGHQ